MILTKRIMLLPTKEQELLFWKSVGIARWSYNYFLAENQKCYKETGKYTSGFDVQNKIVILKNTTHPWLKEVGSRVIKQAVMDAERAIKDYFKGLRNYPHFHTKKKSIPSFYLNYETLKKTQNGFRGANIGFVKTVEPLPNIRKDQKYHNPRIKYDGKYWYLTIGYEIEEKQYQLTDNIIGIDLGIKELAVCSDGDVYRNINKSKKMKKLEKKLNREQRKLSRMIENNIKGYTSNRKPIFKRPLSECSNFQKQKRKLKLLYRRISNIRNNYIHHVTKDIVNKLPKKIVMENLNIKGMMKNKHLSKRISEQKFYDFKRKIKYKSKLRKIEFIEVPRFYPSSKTCSCCGNVKQDLRLKDRIYICDICGLNIDRDLNASINLANYKSE